MLQLQIKEKIKKVGLTATKRRVNVLKLFIQLNKPIDLKIIKNRCSDIDRVTLFRILSVFEDKKIIHSFILSNGQKLYALCNQDCETSKSDHVHNHIHFQCDDCDTVMCLPVTKFPKIKIPNYILRNVDINASGKCSKCTV